MSFSLTDLPETIHVPLLMSHPNESILIHDGDFILKNESIELIITGRIEFKWFPQARPAFTGTTLLGSLEKFMLLSEAEKIDIIIDGEYFGECRLFELEYNSSNEPIHVKGIVLGRPIKGDRTINVTSARFFIPNLTDLQGKPIIRYKGEKLQSSHARLIFDSPKYQIILDKEFEYDHKRKALYDNGGYLFLYRGEITKHKGSLSLDEVDGILSCFSTFISFINGRSTSTMFTHGISDEVIKWTDYSSNFLEPYKGVRNLIEAHRAKHIVTTWSTFYKLWQDSDHRYFLESVIGWYLDANSLNGGLHGSIVMTQTALELLYNWLIVEQRKLIAGKDTENIAASNKIRLLLSVINVDYSIPDGLHRLFQYNKETNKKNPIDAPELLVQIRNAIVHSQAEKRKSLSSIPLEVRQEALQLYIWYIEMAILFILDYQGEYINRCSSERCLHSKLTPVPWLRQA